jgi:oligopeptide transport system substrate-binding protein
MIRSKTWFVISVLMIVTLVLTACQAPSTPPAPVVVTQIVEKAKEGEKVVVVATSEPAKATEAPKVEAGPTVMRIGGGEGDIPTIDTAMATDSPSIQLIEAMTVGLVRQNEETAELVNGMVTEYKFSDDGKTITFKLRNDVPWVKYDSAKKQVVKIQTCPDKDGKSTDRMVTAKDFEYGILRTLSPKTASEYAYVLLGIKGADAYNTDKEKDAAKVGVKAVDDTTLELTFTEPAVYNLNIAGLWVAHAQPKWIIEGDDCTQGRADKWTETGFYQGYGPYTLKEWVHDSYITLAKNPFWPGSKDVPQAKIDEISTVFLPASAALAEYEAGNLDYVGVPLGDYDRITTDAQFKDQVFMTYTLGTEFYSFQTQLEPTNDVRVRKALSLSIDRESILKNINKSGKVAPFFTNPGAAGGPKPDKYADLGVKYDPEQAKKLMDEYLKEKNLTADKINIVLMFNTSESHKKRAEAIQDMWKKTLGINVQLTNQETKVYYKSRKAGKENVYRSSWVQDYPDANNFLNDVFGANGGYKDIVKWEGPKHDEFLKIIGDAAKEKDPAKRMDLYAQAEKILVVDEAVVTPLYWYASPVLIRNTIKHTQSITGYDFYEKWELTK